MFITGIVNRFDSGEKEAKDRSQRLNKLSSLQSRLVEHAASFPGVQRIVIFKEFINN